LYPVKLTQSHFPAQTDEPVLERTVPDALRAAAREFANAVALVEAGPDGTTGRSWTFNALLEDTEKLALALASRFAPGERVAIWAPNIPEWVMFEFAAGMAGLTVVTVNPAYQPKELRYVLTQSRAAGLFLTREFRGNPMAEIAREAAREIPYLRHIVDLQDAEALHARGDRTVDLPTVGPGDAAMIQYTSGTTGFPKGAVLHHQALVNNSRHSINRMGARPGDNYLNVMPLFHIAGCGIGVMGTIQAGTRQILMNRFDPNGAMTLLERERINIFCGVPTMLTAMLEAHARNPRDTSALRVVMSGGAMVPPPLVKRIQENFGCDFEIVFGQTEGTLLAQSRHTDSFADVSETVGQPLPHIEIAIRDVATGRATDIGEQGEICARSYANMLGYNDNPEATTAAIDADGWLHTGDLGTLDSRGYLHITGRVKDMIIRGGENLFPAEIENVLLEHPGVAEVSVVGVPDPHWGEIAVCFLRAAGTMPTREELIVHLRKQLAAQKTPAHWIALESFPLTGSGKIQKFVLRDRFIAGEFPDRL